MKNIFKKKTKMAELFLMFGVQCKHDHKQTEVPYS